MFSRLLIVLTAVLSVVSAGYWPAFLERAALNARQVIGADTTTDAAGGLQETTPATVATVPTVATTPTAQTQQATVNPATEETTQAAAATETTPVANPATAVATTPTTALTNTRTTTTPPAAVAPVVPVNPAAAPAAPPSVAVDPASFSVPFEDQTGIYRYAPMPIKPGTKITVKNVTPQYPTSSYNIFTTNMPAGSVVQTFTQPQTYASIQSSEALVRLVNGFVYGNRLLTSHRTFPRLHLLQMPTQLRCKST